MEECRILDALNGIVLSGEVLLEQFHEAFLKRTKTALKHSGELRVFLDQLDILKGCDQRNEFSVAGLDILFQCLKQTNKNYPLAVRNALKELGYGKNEDELQLDEIITRLEPGEPEIADNMRATFCLIHRIMVDQETTSANGLRPLYQLSKIRPSEVPKCCSIMVTAFTLLQVRQSRLAYLEIGSRCDWKDEAPLEKYLSTIATLNELLWTYFCSAHIEFDR